MEFQLARSRRAGRRTATNTETGYSQPSAHIPQAPSCQNAQVHGEAQRCGLSHARLSSSQIRSRARLFSSHPEPPRVEFAAHASLFRDIRQSPVDRGNELTCKTTYISAAVKTA